MARYGRGEDGVYRDPASLGTRLIMLGLVLIVLGTIATFATRCRRSEQAAVPSSAPVRIACVGDSITYGFGLRNPAETCWVSLLPGLLDNGSTTENYGVSGTCVIPSGYLPWTRSAQAHRFWDAEEDVVILMLGTNDTAEPRFDSATYEQAYLELVDEIAAKPRSPRIYVMIPPCIFAGPPSQDALLVEEIEPAIKRVAEQTGATVIDLHVLTEGHPEWFDDGLHPNEEGNAAIAEFVAEALLAD